MYGVPHNSSLMSGQIGRTWRQGSQDEIEPPMEDVVNLTNEEVQYPQKILVIANAEKSRMLLSVISFRTAPSGSGSGSGSGTTV